MPVTTAKAGVQSSLSPERQLDASLRLHDDAQLLNSLEYCASCCADKIASIGVNAWR